MKGDRMKHWNLVICASLALAVMAGCERVVKPLPELPVAENPVVNNLVQQKMPSPAPSGSVTESPASAVTITLEPRGLLKAPVMTAVADSRQTYTIMFREDMNRRSVEEALGRLAPAGGQLPAKPELHFEWQNDRLLHLTVTTNGIGDNPYPSRGYTLDVNGALMESGKALADAPTFRALVQKPSQLWRISAADGFAEKVSMLTEPFNLQSLQDPGYMLGTQFLDYCECDATLPKLYSVYNIERDEMTTYPVSLMIQYKGRGDFTVDTRGFFYEQPTNGVQVPFSDSAVRVHIDGYIHGARLSHDHKQVLLAVGQETQDKDLDFVIYNIETKEAKTLSKKLVGQVPSSEVSSVKIPVQFQDDGALVYMYMHNDQLSRITEYRYSWSNGLLETWKPPVDDNAWSGFIPSDDGAYRFYHNGGLYRGSEPIDLPDYVYPTFWLHGTHNFVYSMVNENSPEAIRTLDLYNVDENKSQEIAKLPPGEHSLIGGSADGRWLYIFTTSNLQQGERTP
jgi:hypothetical protein